MKIMVVWKTVPGKYKTALDQFLKVGGPVPEGAKTVGRWHTKFQLSAGTSSRRATWRSSPSTWQIGLLFWSWTSIR